ncbi:MAG: RIP metalloprotease RseP [Akkermansiaceae bacterium]
MTSLLSSILIILLVVIIFNVIIFVHELGHFLAARWRGLEVERFQIWFGKPIWKKKHNGVQYGLGWLPFGGFVALPQMAPMESIEGKNAQGKVLPPVKPLDKIIVAAAGPLFSFLLAFLTAFLVWGLGKPDQRIVPTTIGYVQEGSPAMEAGLMPNDTIIAINGTVVDCFQGNMDTGITENIIISEGNKITFKVQRPNVAEPLDIVSTFDIPETSWWQRKGMRKVGIRFKEKVIVGSTLENSPAAEAGLQAGDIVLSINGTPATSINTMIDAAESTDSQQLTVLRNDKEVQLSITARKPKGYDQTAFGIAFAPDVSVFEETISHPGPWQQIKDAAGAMKKTLQLVSSKESSIGIDQLAGPIGIGKGYFQMFTSSADGWKMALSFTVLFNINLAILNMMPFPVLDGGHITLSLLEIIFRRPVKARVLEVVQTGFVLIIMSLFLYITSKDVGSFFNPQEKRAPMEFAPSKES